MAIASCQQRPGCYGPRVPQASDDNDGLPEHIRQAWNDHDIDTAVEWLLSGSAEDPWPDTDTCNGIAVSAAQILLSVDPSTTLRLLRTLLSRATASVGRLHLLELQVDAAARANRDVELRQAHENLTETLKDVAEPQVRVAVLNNVATYLKGALRFDAAEETLRQLLAEPSLRPSDRAAVWVNLATVLGERALMTPGDGTVDIAVALSALDQAQVAADASPSSATLGGIWFNRAYLFARTGHSAAAEHAYAQSWEAYVAAGSEPYDLAYVRRGQAAEAARNGRLDDAVTAYEQARDLFLQAGHFDEASRATVGLIMALATRGTPLKRGLLDDLLAAIRRARPAEAAELLINVGNIVGRDDPASGLAVFRTAAGEFRALGRERDYYRARHSQAAMHRRLGSAELSLRLLNAIRITYSRWGLTKETAEVDFNRSIALLDLGRSGEALEASLYAIEELDRHRHLLSGPADRMAITAVTYPHLFDLALQCARECGEYDLVAALTERARVQTSPAVAPVPGSAQLEPPPAVSAGIGRRVVAGRDPTRFLTEVAEDAAGRGASWLGFARQRDELLRVVVTPGGTDVTSCPWPEDLLLDLTAAIADHTAEDLEACSDPHEASRRALHRAATGPLLSDAHLADLLEGSLPARQAHRWKGRACDAESFLPALAAAFLPPWLPEGPLAIAPPSAFGRVPWAALPYNARALIEDRDIVLVPPIATVSVRSSEPVSGTRALFVADPRGDLRYCRAVPDVDGLVMTSATEPRATRAALLQALRTGQFSTLIVRGHVRPGTASDPLSTAVLLADGEEVSARDLLANAVRAPDCCVVLGCDAAGAATGGEWAGLPLAFGVAGASTVLATLWPVIDDRIQERLDLDLLGEVLTGPREGLWSWQRRRAQDRREAAPEQAVYRWANVHAVATAVSPSGAGRDP